MNPWKMRIKSSETQSSLPLLNYTRLNEDTRKFTNQFEGFAPRWTLLGNLLNPNNTAIKAATMVLIMDTKKEIDIGLGR